MKMTAITWKEIKIGGMVSAFVCVVQGKEIGTICKPGRTSAWSVAAGIGERSKIVGMNYDKRAAKEMLVTAPESFWK
jgi:hypothetical protein